MARVESKCGFYGGASAPSVASTTPTKPKEAPMFDSIIRFATQRPKRVIALWAVVAIALASLASMFGYKVVTDDTARFLPKHSESAQATKYAEADEVVAGDAAADLLDVDVYLVALAVLAVVRRAVDGHVHGERARAVVGGVEARAAEQAVAVEPAVQAVLARVAEEIVDAAVAGQLVATVAAVQLVVAVATVQLVAAVGAEHDVVAAPAVEQVLHRAGARDRRGGGGAQS